MTAQEVPKPEVTKGLNSFTYDWPDLAIRVNVSRIDDEGYGELAFYYNNGNGIQPLHIAKHNLLSTSSAVQLAKRLQKNIDLNWDAILAQTSMLTLEAIRKGQPSVPIGMKPDAMILEYQLWPVLQRGQPTTIYGPGGTAKGYLAVYIASLVQYGILGFDNEPGTHHWRPNQGNVLYCDWEAGERELKRRAWAVKQGLGLSSDATFEYLFCDKPLEDCLHNVQEIVSTKKIDLVIIDSQMAAASHGPDAAQLASQFYNALRSLRCTTLTIDHVDKVTWRGESEAVGPYGSVVKYNRSRLQFEVRSYQTPGENFVKVALKHRKNNEGPLIKDAGIRIDFLNDKDGTLDMVTFCQFDVQDDPVLAREPTVWEKIKNCLEMEPMTPREISTETGVDEKTIRTELYRRTNSVEKNGDKHKGQEVWQLKSEGL